MKGIVADLRGQEELIGRKDRRRKEELLHDLSSDYSNRSGLESEYHFFK